jgi:hypothetical protein
MLRELIAFGKAAGAKSETDSERDGFLSYHAESHSAALGVSGGWFAVVQGDMALLSVVYSAAVYGKASGMGDNPKRRRLLRDVAQEPHYALVGVVVGALLGVFTGQFGVETRSATEVVEALPL